MNSSNYTFINDLPELQDESSNPNIQKFIRNPHQPMHEAGMNPYQENQYQDPYKGTQYEANPQYQSHYSDVKDVPYVKEKEPISCLDICNHIENCRLCSKLYNNDRTIYIITIIFLLIVCILLFKRILNV